MAILIQVNGTVLFSVPDEELEQYAIPFGELEAVLKHTNIKLGVAATPEEVASGRVVTGEQRAADEPRASAAYLYFTTVVCPGCYTSRRVMVNSESYNIYECSNCRFHYRA